MIPDSVFHVWTIDKSLSVINIENLIETDLFRTNKLFNFVV